MTGEVVEGVQIRFWKGIGKLTPAATAVDLFITERYVACSQYKRCKLRQGQACQLTRSTGICPNMQQKLSFLSWRLADFKAYKLIRKAPSTKHLSHKALKVPRRHYIPTECHNLQEFGLLVKYFTTFSVEPCELKI